MKLRPLRRGACQFRRDGHIPDSYLNTSLSYNQTSVTEIKFVPLKTRNKFENFFSFHAIDVFPENVLDNRMLFDFTEFPHLFLL